jgi:hypothetical protein
VCLSYQVCSAQHFFIHKKSGAPPIFDAVGFKTKVWWGRNDKQVGKRMQHGSFCLQLCALETNAPSMGIGCYAMLCLAGIRISNVPVVLAEWDQQHPIHLSDAPQAWQRNPHPILRPRSS